MVQTHAYINILNKIPFLQRNSHHKKIPRNYSDVVQKYIRVDYIWILKKMKKFNKNENTLLC